MLALGLSLSKQIYAFISMDRSGENHSYFANFDGGVYGGSAQPQNLMYTAPHSHSHPHPASSTVSSRNSDFTKSPQDMASVLQDLMNITTQSLDDAQSRLDGAADCKTIGLAWAGN